MDISGNNKRGPKVLREGEIALTLTLVSLAVILMGTLLGTRQAVRNQVQTYLSNAQTTKECGVATCAGPSDTSCGAEMQCRDTGRSPFGHTYQCVKQGVSCRPAAQNSCWCTQPSPTPQSPTPGGSGGLPSPTPRLGGAFDKFPGKCEVSFHYVVDPQVAYVELSTSLHAIRLNLSRNGIFLSDQKITTKAGSLVVRYNPLKGGNGFGKDDIYISVQPDGVSSPTILLYNRPVWMDGTQVITVDFAYSEIIAGTPRVSHVISQMLPDLINCAPPVTPTPPVSATPSPTPRISVTPTATPIPRRPVCGSPCTTDTDCRGATRLKFPVCYFSPIEPPPGTPRTGVCHESACRDVDTCLCRPTATPRVPSPTPSTLTPTPYIPVGGTSTPIPTPPVACNADMIFVLDNSGTMAGQKLADAKAAILKHTPDTGAQYKLITFNAAATNLTGNYVPKSQLTTIISGVNTGHGTNITKALAAANAALAGSPSENPYVVFISDGVPSIDSNRCFYSNSPDVSKLGATTDQNAGTRNSEGIFIPNAPYHTSNAICQQRKYGFVIADVVKAAKPANTIAVGIPGTDAFNVPLMRNIGTKGYVEPSSLDKSIGDAIKQICQQAVTKSQDNRRGGQSTRTSVFSTLALTNNTDTRTVNNVTISLCDRTGSCSTHDEPVNLLPGNSLRIPARFEAVSKDSQYTMKCTLTYTDGSQENCPDNTVVPGSASKVAVQISQNGPLSANTTTKQKSCDTNNDGVCSAIDYALTVANYGITSGATLTATDLAGDANFDGSVDSIDLSIVLAGLGE